MKTQTVTILGLDRLSTSVGLALKQSPLAATLIGYDEDRAQAQQAKQLGAVDKTEWNLLSAAMKADILVLRLPVSQLEATLEVIGPDLQPHALVVDLSAGAAAGIQWADQYLTQGHYVSGMPILAAAWMADGRSTLDTATPDLFRSSVFCLMPAARADAQAVETAVNFGYLLGAKPYFLQPEEFDNLQQGSETLPRLAAAAIFRTLQSSPGWRDMLRFAGAPLALATTSLETSADTALLALQDPAATLRWLDGLIAQLTEMRSWIQRGDAELFNSLLLETQVEREKWTRARQKNDWVEGKAVRVPNQSFAEQMLGGLVTGRDRKEQDE